jgi:small subunit ribosomal protein S6
VSVNTYETVFIAEPEISNDQVDQLITKIKAAVAANEGTLTGEDRWGRRRMAYTIHGHREGYYAILSFTAGAGVVSAIEHLYNVTDSVIRHLTTRVIKSKKTFRPRKERPAGHAEGSRYAGRSSGGYRGRSESPASAKPQPPSASVGGAATEPLPAGRQERPDAPAAQPTPEGGTPS